MMKAILTAAVLAAVGCNGVGVQIPGDGQLVIVSYDDAFETHLLPTGEPESFPVRAGIVFWNQLGANLKTPDEVTEEERRRAPSYSLKRDDFSWPGSDTTGVTWPCLGYATIYPNALRGEGAYDEVGVRSVVAHEIGHAIGLYHVPSYSVMNSGYYWPGDYPSAGDVAEYRRVYGGAR